jgi:hypothetical protein
MADNDIDWIALPDLAGELAKLTGAAPPPCYRVCYNGAVSALFPSEKRNGRRGVRRSNLPAVARALGLTVPAAPGSRRREPAAPMGDSDSVSNHPAT